MRGMSISSVKNVRLAHRSVYHFLATSSIETIQGTDRNGAALTGSVLLLRACIKAMIHILDRVVRVHVTNADAHAQSLSFVAQTDPLMWFYRFALKWWVSRAQKAEWETNEAQTILQIFSGQYFNRWYQIGNANTYDSSMTLNILLKRSETPQEVCIVISDDGHLTHLGIHTVSWPGWNIPCYEPALEISENNTSVPSQTSEHKDPWVFTLTQISYGQNGKQYQEAVPNNFLEFAISFGLTISARKLLELQIGKKTSSGLATSESGARLLFAVARGGSVQLADILFQHALQLNMESSWIAGCLSRAIFYHHFALAKSFIGRGMDLHSSGIYYRDLKGEPMAVAVKHSNKVAINLLIDSGIDINSKISYWGTALQYAAQLLRVNMVTFLLNCGADVNASVPRAIYGSALEAVLFSPHIISVFEIEFAPINIMHILLERGADVNAIRPVTKFPLVWAAALERIWVAVEELFRLGAKVDGVDANGHTFLYHVLCTRQSDIRGRPYYRQEIKIWPQHGTGYLVLPSPFRSLLDNGATLNEKDILALISQVSSIGSLRFSLTQLCTALYLLTLHGSQDKGLKRVPEDQAITLLAQLVQTLYLHHFSCKLQQNIKSWIQRARLRLQYRTEIQSRGKISLIIYCKVIAWFSRAQRRVNARKLQRFRENIKNWIYRAKLRLKTRKEMYLLRGKLSFAVYCKIIAWARRARLHVRARPPQDLGKT